MVKERKSVAFSTRFTESMDKTLEELSDVKMLTLKCIKFREEGTIK